MCEACWCGLTAEQHKNWLRVAWALFKGLVR
jgi:hypothetical protein